MKECKTSGMRGIVCKGYNGCLALDDLNQLGWRAIPVPDEEEMKRSCSGCPKLDEALELRKQLSDNN